MAVTEENGVTNRFKLEADSIFFGQELRVVGKLGEESGGQSKDWNTYLAKLILQPPSGEPDENGVRECDILAADPHDSEKLAPGVDFNKEDIDLDNFDRAIDACIAAVENVPNDKRQQFQLGRLYWYAGDQSTAKEYIELAAAQKYAPAIYYQAQILLGESDHPNTFVDALEMFEASGNAGYARGATMVKELNPEGIEFFREIPQPSSNEILAILRKNRKCANFLGISTCMGIDNIQKKECVQISATDFSCQYLAVRGASTNASSAHSWLLNMAAKADSTTDFGRFRKSENGWVKVE